MLVVFHIILSIYFLLSQLAILDALLGSLHQAIEVRFSCISQNLVDVEA